MSEFNTPVPEECAKNTKQETPKRLRLGAEALMLGLRSFTIKGSENLETLSNDDKYIVTSAHLSNLDAPAAIKALGEKFNMQITAQSLLTDEVGQKIMFQLGGKENFSFLDYHLTPTDRAGSFNPDNFASLESKMDEGKTPWIAIHPFNLDGKMTRASIGPIYLAQKARAKIIPTALEIQGEENDLSIHGWKGFKALIKRLNGTYHIGQPIELEPIDVGIIDTVIEKRKKRKEKIKNGEEITAEDRISPEDLAEFHRVHKTLQEQSEQIGVAISEMLPPKQQGYYKRQES